VRGNPLPAIATERTVKGVIVNLGAWLLGVSVAITVVIAGMMFAILNGDIRECIENRRKGAK